MILLKEGLLIMLQIQIQILSKPAAFTLCANPTASATSYKVIGVLSIGVLSKLSTPVSFKRKKTFDTVVSIIIITFIITGSWV